MPSSRRSFCVFLQVDVERNGVQACCRVASSLSHLSVLFFYSCHMPSSCPVYLVATVFCSFTFFTGLLLFLCVFLELWQLVVCAHVQVCYRLSTENRQGQFSCAECSWTRRNLTLVVALMNFEGGGFPWMVQQLHPVHCGSRRFVLLCCFTTLRGIRDRPRHTRI